MSFIRNTNNHELPIIHYLQFQTALIKTIKNNTRKHHKLSAAFKALMKIEDLFIKMPNNEYHLRVDWPYREASCDMLIIAYKSEKEYVFRFAVDSHTFLTITFQDDEARVESINLASAKAQWSNSDIDQIVNHFTEMFNIKKIYYITDENDNSKLVKKSSSASYTYNKYTFESHINQYQGYMLNSAIQHCIYDKARKCLHSFTFYLKWPDHVGHERTLKGRFARGDEFTQSYNNGSTYSWFVTEDVLLNHFPEYQPYHIKQGQYYYSLRIYEISDETGESETELLSLWFTSDGIFGELRDLQKGKYISGNGVVGIYLFFDSLFKIKKTFLCDESKLVSEDNTTSIPLRLILSIVSGETWYQSKIPGLTLFECDRFQTSENDKITQHNKERIQAINDLQQLKLSKWYKMLKSYNQDILADLYYRYFDNGNIILRHSERLGASPHFFKMDIGKTQTTLKELAIKIYNESKIKQTVTPDLIAFSRLLCEGTYLMQNTSESENTDPDYWVKSRVNVILEQSRFWIRDRSEESTSIRRLM